MYKKEQRFPLKGPVYIDDYKSFLEKSKEEFSQLQDRDWVEDCRIEDFVVIKVLVKGSFGVTRLVKNKNDGNLYSKKTIDIASIKISVKEENIENEYSVLKGLNFPLTIYLEHYIKEDNVHHLFLPFIAGIELFQILKERIKFQEHEVKFIGAQVVLCIEYLHNIDVIHRDLKPESMIIDSTGYMKLVDFKNSKILKGRTYSICGTPEYLAPEVILSKGYGKSVDWWAFGILLFELLTGRTPFHDKLHMNMFEKSSSANFKMPGSCTSDLQELLKNVLQPDLTKRFGNLKNGVDDIKNHQWFVSIDWMLLLSRKIKSPISSKTVSQLNSTKPVSVQQKEMIQAISHSSLGLISE